MVIQSSIMKKIAYLFSLLVVTSLLNACQKDNPPLPDNLVQFETNELGFDAESSSIDIHLNVTRNVDAEVPLTINLVSSGVTYGTEFTTSPAATGNNLSLTVPAGSNSISFKVNKTPNIFLQGDESITFKIGSAGSPLLIGAPDSLQLRFSAITSTGSQLTLDGGPGDDAAENSVFVDMSANKQTPVKRDSWDLGFYNGDDFRVILNYTLVNAMAVALNKNDLDAVTAQDTAGLVLESTFSPDDLKKVDDVSGDLNKTVVGDIAADDADNKVYILNRGGLVSHSDASKGWIKFRVLRNAIGYTLQYANIADANFKTVNIPKEPTHQFSFVSLDNGQQVPVQPAKGLWDFQWGLASYTTAGIYYPFADLVFINFRDGVQAAEVMTSTVSYDNFNESNIAAITFSSNRDVIGSNWRATTGTKGVKTDRFYVLKDPAGNIYKLKFINFIADDGGKRGYPNISYQLVKKGD